MITRTKLLSRTERTRDCWVCVIVTEGFTEEQYFTGLQERNIIPRSRVKVVPVPPNPELHDSAPNGVCSRAKDYRRTHELVPDIDQVWLLFDKDRWSNKQLAAAIRQAKAAGYRWAVSNRCFEVWLILHHTDDLDGLQIGDHYVKRLRQLLGSYNKTELDITRFPPDTIRTAINRARQVSPKLQGWPTTPGTQVYALLETLLPTSAS